MDKADLTALLDGVKNSTVSVEEAILKIKNMPFHDLGYAKIDSMRALRTGYPEVIYCEGKKTDHILGIVNKLIEKKDQNILLTRLSKEAFEKVSKICPNADLYEDIDIIYIKVKEVPITEKTILVVCAGTSDIKVADEAYITAEVFGNRVEKLYDVGVAGLHRLLSNIEKIQESNVIIVAAGMDGALASVVAGLTQKPVIAVPTSVGYGASFNGLSPLLSMLNSCAGGVGVVNIDNGFGAGMLASKINKL